MKEKRIDGAKCAGCGESVGLIQVNGVTVAVQPDAAILGKFGMVIEFHRCKLSTAAASEVEPATSTRPKRGWRR